MKRILLVDNFDSFTYNLVHYLEALSCEVDVRFNTEIPEQILETYDAVVLSPGPGLPEESGELMTLIANYKGKVPILGVCLGMQALAIELGGALYNQQLVKHGVQERISVKRGVLFSVDQEDFVVGLYHSWGVSIEGDYHVTAKSQNGVVMAIENDRLRCYGVQFHPESIMTPGGKEVLKRFLAVVPEALVVSAE
ncbi:MAG: anthranilate synthase component II [Fluviicola sp.]